MAWRKNSLTENRSSNKIGNACNRASNDYPEKLACCVEERLLERERELKRNSLTHSEKRWDKDCLPVRK